MMVVAYFGLGYLHNAAVASCCQFFLFLLPFFLSASSLSLFTSMMADLTVLVSPSPLYVPQPTPITFTFAGRKRHSAVSRPVTPMITLESTHNRSPSEPSSKDQSLLSPPINTWKSRPKTFPPARPLSAPPSRTKFDVGAEDRLPDFPSTSPRPIFAARRRGSSFSSSSGVRELIRPP